MSSKYRFLTEELGGAMGLEIASVKDSGGDPLVSSDGASVWPSQYLARDENDSNQLKTEFRVSEKWSSVESSVVDPSKSKIIISAEIEDANIERETIETTASNILEADKEETNFPMDRNVSINDGEYIEEAKQSFLETVVPNVRDRVSAYHRDRIGEIVDNWNDIVNGSESHAEWETDANQAFRQDQMRDAVRSYDFGTDQTYSASDIDHGDASEPSISSEAEYILSELEPDKSDQVIDRDEINLSSLLRETEGTYDSAEYLEQVLEVAERTDYETKKWFVMEYLPEAVQEVESFEVLEEANRILFDTLQMDIESHYTSEEEKHEAEYDQEAERDYTAHSQEPGPTTNAETASEPGYLRRIRDLFSN